MLSPAHLFYIPAVLVLGLVLGFFLGARAVRGAYLAEQRKAEEREKAEREAKRER